MSDYVKPQSPMLIGDTHFYPLTTIDQIIKSDDTRLSEDDLGLSMELLWTNASPTSSFSAQTISVDLSDYDWIVVSSYEYVSDSTRLSKHYDLIQVGGGKASIVNPYVSDSSQDTALTYARSCTATTSSVAFGGGHTLDLLCVPYQIWGIK